MKHPIHRFMLAHSFTIAMIGFALIIIFLSLNKWKESGTIGVQAAAVIAGFIYFVQKQSLEDTSLFSKLFADFNLRYKNLNDTLATISGITDSKQNKAIEDYFDLCAEEYLYYSQGYVLPVVWKAWCNGILLNLERSPELKRRWEAEFKVNPNQSYYGLDDDEVRKGAAS